MDLGHYIEFHVTNVTRGEIVHGLRLDTGEVLEYENPDIHLESTVGTHCSACDTYIVEKRLANLAEVIEHFKACPYVGSDE